MQTKQIQPGGVYAFGNANDIQRYGHAPHLVVAMGPYYVAGPARYVFGDKRNPNEFGYVITADGKRADGVAVLQADEPTEQSVISHLRQLDWVLTKTDSLRAAIAHVEETLKLLQTGERIDLDRLDIPAGWSWKVIKPQRVLGDYASEMKAYEDRQNEKKDKQLAENQRFETNEARLEAVAEELVRGAVASASRQVSWAHPYGNWDTPRNHPDPTVEIRLSVLEKLLGIEVPQQ